MAQTVQDVLNVALGEVGYLEKRSNSNLDSKTANAGSANYTKYGAWYGVNPAQWCAMFVSYCVSQAGMDAATITALSQAAYEWGVVCTTYYAYLKQYIAVETDVDKLSAIDFGKALPNGYMQQLAALLSSAGIDITKYTAALTGG